jgi:RNA polymerase sigma-70 factor (ECF subfamily)
MVPPTPKTLLQKIRDAQDASSPEAARLWARFENVYQAFIYRWAQRAGLQDADADNAVQEVFIRLLRHLPNFEYDPAKGRFRDWLRWVIRSAAEDIRRKNKRQGARGGEEPPNDIINPDPLEEFDGDFVREVLMQSLQQVKAESDEQTWRCFEECVIKGRRRKEVAEELGMKPNTVTQNGCRVRARVRKRFEELAAEKLKWEGPDNE